MINHLSTPRSTLMDRLNMTEAHLEDLNSPNKDTYKIALLGLRSSLGNPKVFDAIISKFRSADEIIQQEFISVFEKEVQIDSPERKKILIQFQEIQEEQNFHNNAAEKKENIEKRIKNLLQQFLPLSLPWSNKQ